MFPRQRLVFFHRIHDVRPRETRVVTLASSLRDFTTVDSHSGVRSLLPAAYTVEVGDSQDALFGEIRITSPSAAEGVVLGEAVPPGALEQQR